MRYCTRCDNTRWVCEHHLDRPFLGERACGAAPLAHLARTATKLIRPTQTTSPQCLLALSPILVSTSTASRPNPPSNTTKRRALMHRAWINESNGFRASPR
jgi:hypothetical protein